MICQPLSRSVKEIHGWGNSGEIERPFMVHKRLSIVAPGLTETSLCTPSTPDEAHHLHLQLA